MHVSGEGNIDGAQTSTNYVHTNRQNNRTGQGGSEATILFDRSSDHAEALYAAFRGLRKKASAGVDGVTYQMYEKDAARNIQQLHGRLKEASTGLTAAQDLHPKENGKERTYLHTPWRTRSCRSDGRGAERIYEQDFFECSYGFRLDEGRTTHWTRWDESSAETH